MTVSLAAGEELASRPTVPVALQVTSGVAWSPKLVKVKADRPEGAALDRALR